MAGGNQSPRQKMINLMYLVLLAMLAMQASKDLLNAFTLIEDGIKVTNESFDKQNQSIYDAIQTASLTNTQESLDVLYKSRKIQDRTHRLIQEIQSHKNNLIAETGGWDEDSIPIAKDNQDYGATYFLHKKHGQVLENKIDSLKHYLSNQVSPIYKEVKTKINTLLETPTHTDHDGIEHSWSASFTEHMPLVAVTAYLTNLQSHIKNAETTMISYLYNQVKDNQFKFDELKGIVLPQKSYVLQNDSFKANVFLSAFSKEISPTIYIGNYNTTLLKEGQLKFEGDYDSIPIDNGVGIYQTIAEKVGNTQWKGIIKIKHPNPKKQNSYLYYPFDNEYIVAQPQATISLTKMNTVYIGLPNPIEVSVPGRGDKKIVVRYSHGGVSQSTYKVFNLTPTRNGIGKVTVYLQSENGLTKMSEMKVIARNLPTPEVLIPAWTTTCITSGRARIADKLFARYETSFPYQATCKIKSFTMFIKGGELKSNSGNFTSEMKKALRNLSQGESVTIENIIVVGPDNIPVPYKGVLKHRIC